MKFRGPMWFWRGPSPFHFVTVPAKQSKQIASAAALVTYGWGMIPVEVTIGKTTFTTSLWPKDGGYIVPLKQKVRDAEELELGDAVTVQLVLGRST